MTELSLHSDCSQCAALCCVAFAFDKSEEFAIDKAAEEPCPNLDTCGQCKVHEDLAQCGFRGCVLYECHGAGQRVTQELFGGQSWQKTPSLVRPMVRAFAVVRRAHDLLVLLRAAGDLPLTERECAQVDVYANELNEIVALGREEPALSRVEEVSGIVHGFLRTLSRHVDRDRAR